jgi:hypothetical protein
MEDKLLLAHLASATPLGRALYEHFVQALHRLGPFSTHPAKSTITFKGSRRGFCGAHPKKDVLVGYFDLMREAGPDPRIRSVSAYTKTLYVHQFRVHRLEDIDSGFVGWLAQAYEVGQGAHLRAAKPTPVVGKKQG